jgi:hypothetical protein
MYPMDDNNNAYWLKLKAEHRGVLVVPGDRVLKMCAEPSPDVAMRTGADINITVDSINEGSAIFSTVPIALEGRTEVIIFLRESLYRLCELSLNHPISKEDIQHMYSSVIGAALTFANAESAKATAALARAKNANIKAIDELERARMEKIEDPKQLELYVEQLIKKYEIENKILEKKLEQ